MENILLSLNVVFPLLVMMAVGYFLKYIKFLDDHSLTVMNKLDFRAFLSSMLFINVYNLDANTIFDIKNLRMLIFVAIFVFAELAFAWIIFSKTIPKRTQRSVMIQGLFRSNLVLFGMVISNAIFGEGKGGMTAIMGAFIVPLFNVLAVIVLESYRDTPVDAQGHNRSTSLKKVLLGIVTNPLIIAAFLGLLFLITGIKIPNLILSPITSLGRIATPLAFVILGGTLKFKSLMDHAKYVTVITILRLVVCPLIGFFIAIKVLGFSGQALIAIFGAIGTPTAVSSFNMAKDMGADGDLAGEIVVATSVFSILSAFGWILLFKNIGVL